MKVYPLAVYGITTVTNRYMMACIHIVRIIVYFSGIFCGLQQHDIFW